MHMKIIKLLFSKREHSFLFYLKNQILLFVCFIFLFYVGIISLFIVYGYNKVITDKTTELTEAYMETINTSLDILQSHTVEAASILKNSTDIQNALSAEDYDTSSIFHYNSAVRKAMINIMYSNSQINMIYIGNSQYSYQSNVHALSSSRWPNYRQFCLHLEGYDENSLFSGIWMTGSELGIVSPSSLFFVQGIRNLDTIDRIGLIVIEVKSSFLDQAIRSVRYGEESTIAFVKNDKLLYTNQSVIPEKELIRFASLYSAEDSGVSDITELDSQKYFLSVRYNPALDLSAISLISYQSLTRESSFLHIVIILVIIIFFAFLMIFTYVFSNRLVQQVALIKDIFENPDHIPETGLPFKENEIGAIGQECEDLMRRYHRSLKQTYELNLRQKESALLRLQSQINPHFLYNTLDSIFWMSETNGNHDAAQMALYLSRYFRSNINSQELMITLADEISSIKNYLAIQNIRYNNKFHLDIDVAQELFSKRILRMLIQPLIENAIYHGLEPQTGPGSIKLSAEHKDNALILKVKDNGIGFQTKNLKKGLALKNIEERIHLFYGDSYGMQIESCPSCGTTVILILAWEVKEDV